MPSGFDDLSDSVAQAGSFVGVVKAKLTIIRQDVNRHLQER